MPYIGRELDRGNYLKLDDISSSFDSSTTTFNLTNGGKAFYPGSAFSILVVLAGVVQEPETAYQINQAQITFASAPLAGDQFFCIALGVALGVNTPANGSVNGTQLAKPFNYDGYFYLDDTNNRVGIATATPQKPLHVVGEGQFDSVRVLGDLTVDGTTTTLDTTVTEVDKLEVNANNTTVAVAITQQNANGDVLNVYDSNGNPVFTTRENEIDFFTTGRTKLERNAGNPQFTLGNLTGGTDGTASIIFTQNQGAAGGRIVSGRDGGYTNGASRISNLQFHTSTSAADSEKVRITSAGNVGIGLTNPTEKLHLIGQVGGSNPSAGSKWDIARFVSHNYVPANSGGLTIGAYWNNTDVNGRRAYIQSSQNLDSGSTVRDLLLNPDGGDVGIGTDNPQSQFEVFGTSPIIRSKHSTSQKYTQINHNGTDGYLDWSSGDLILRGASNTERLRIHADGEVECKGGGAGQNALLVTGNYSSGNNVDIQTWQRTGGAVQAKIGYKDADTSMFFGTDTAHSLAIMTGGTEKLRITSAGRLLLGTETEGQANADNLTIADNNNCGITIRSGSTSGGAIYFSDGTSGGAEYDGYIEYSQNSRFMRFGTATTERLRITSAGLVDISGGVQVSENVTPTSGAGLELFREGNGGGQIQAYDRDNSTSLPLILKGSQIQVFASGSERLRVDSSGRVLISGQAALTSTSLTHSLQVACSSDADGIAIIGRADDISEISFYEADKTTNLGEIQYRQDHVNFRHRVGDIRFATGGVTERLRIDSDGRLLANGAAATNAWAGGDDLIIGNTNNGTRTGITLVSHSGSDGGIYWSDGTGTNVYRGQIAYNHANDAMSFYTAAAARLRITSGGIVIINDANVSTSRADAPLQIETGANGNALNLRARAGDNIYSYLNFQNTAGSQTAAHIYLQRDASTNAGTLVFGTASANANTPTERLKIHSSGATTMHVNSASHDTFRFTTQGSNEAKLIMRDASDNEDIVLNTGGDSWINSADFGIGTNSPGAKLDVLNGTSDGTVTRMRNDEVGIVYGVWGTGSSYPRETSINGTRFDNGTSPYLRIAGQGGIKFCVDLNSERLRIDSNGKVGINSTTPTARLDIDHPHTEQGLIVRSRYGNIADAMVKFDGDPFANGGDGNVLHIHGGSSRTDSEILHIDSTGVGDIFDIRGDGLTRVYKQLQLEHSSNIAKIIFNEYGANDPKAQIEMDQVSSSAGQLIFRTQNNGTISERLRITAGGVLQYNGEAKNVPSSNGSARKVLVTSAYEEWHFTWTGASSRTATFTCSSYFHAEVIYTSHQTNGGADIHRYIRGKWANNHTTHTWVQHEDVGNTWSLSGFSITVGQNGNNSATGKLTISETYNSGSLSTRAVIMRIYYGASSLGYDIA